jgi:hypothetical protein
VRLSRSEVRDHINYRKNDRWRSYRFYKALQRLKSPMRYICEIFGALRFSSFSTQSGVDRKSPWSGQTDANDPFLKCCEGATRLAIDEEAEVWAASSLGPRLIAGHQPRGCDLHGHVARGPAWARP